MSELENSSETSELSDFSLASAVDFMSLSLYWPGALAELDTVGDILRACTIMGL
jgi:hypothetical protein